MKVFLRNHLFLLFILGVLGTDALLWWHGASPGQWIEFTYNGAVVALIFLEFVIPRNPSWNYLTRAGLKFRETAVEIFFFFWSGFFASIATYAFSKWAAAHLRTYFQITTEVSIPAILQAIVILFAVDFLRYWLHRAMHVYPWLWRFHALHHVPERLGTVTSTRTHPVDDLILYVPELILVFTLGFDHTVVGLTYSVIWVISLIKHANIDFVENAFSRHFQLPRYHLIHHGYQDERSPTFNFSEILTFWDKIFGTYRRDPVSPSFRVGVTTDKPRSLLREFFGWLYLPVRRL